MEKRELLEAAARAAGIEQPTGQDGYVAQEGTFVFQRGRAACQGTPSESAWQRPDVFSMTEAQVDAELQALGINPDEAPARVQSAITDAFALADQMRTAKAGSMCPLCGRAYPHEHSPEEITIYRNGMKAARAAAAIDAQRRET